MAIADGTTKLGDRPSTIDLLVMGCAIAAKCRKRATLFFLWLEKTMAMQRSPRHLTTNFESTLNGVSLEQVFKEILNFISSYTSIYKLISSEAKYFIS